MRGAAVAVSRILDKEFREWMNEYHLRASRLAQRDADALGSKWDDAVVGALTGTPLHHLNTTTRMRRDSTTFGCTLHSDKDAGVSRTTSLRGCSYLQ